MVYPLVPFFLTAALGASPAVLGLIEGLAESVASLLKVFSGFISDRIGRRKGLTMAGYAGGAVGKLVCAFIGARLGVIGTVCLTEGLTTLGILALLPLPLEFALVLLPAIGVALNGTSSVLYGTVAEIVPGARRARAFGVFYTLTIGAGAVSPLLYGLLGDAIGVPRTFGVIAAVVLLVLPLTLGLRPALRALRPG